MTIRTMAAVAILAAFSIAAAGCGQRSTTTESTNTTTTAAGDTTSTTTTTTTTTATDLPADCQTYISEVEACATTLAQNSPQGAASVRDAMNRTRAAWNGRMTPAACSQALAAWHSMRGAMGCH